MGEIGIAAGVMMPKPALEGATDRAGGGTVVEILRMQRDSGPLAASLQDPSCSRYAH
jgi:hypothetical protein